VNNVALTLFKIWLPLLLFFVLRVSILESLIHNHRYSSTKINDYKCQKGWKNTYDIMAYF